MSSVEPTSDVWEHGLLPLPGAKLSEASLLALLELQHRLPADLSVGLEQWAGLAAEGLSMRREQAAACMRLCYVLSPSLQTPTQPTRKLPADEAMRVPLGSLLLLLWVQVAQRELGRDGGADGQGAGGERRRVAVAVAVAARRRRVRAHARGAGAHEPARAAGGGAGVGGGAAAAAAAAGVAADAAAAPAAGAGRLRAHELELLGLLLRPDRVSATRLAGRGLPPSSLACALGLWSTQPAAALPISALLPALRAALTEVLAPATAAAEAPPPPPPPPPPPRHRLPSRRGHPSRRAPPTARRNHGRCRRCRRWGSRCR